MKILNAATTVFCIALIGAVLTPGARADEWNRKTTMTFSGPVEIPGVHLKGWNVLPAGTYVFKILDSQSDRHIVQIFNKDETIIYATILAIPNYRQNRCIDDRFVLIKDLHDVTVGLRIQDLKDVSARGQHVPPFEVNAWNFDGAAKRHGGLSVPFVCP